MTAISTYFDYLPTADIIHENIFPYLDYESRINFNRVLPPIERLGRRLPIQAILSHDYFVQYARMNSDLDYIRSYDNPILKRCQRLVTVLTNCKPTGRYAVLLKHNETLRQATINKCLEIADQEKYVLKRASPYFKKKIQLIASQTLSEILEMKPGPTLRKKPIQIL